MARYDVCVIGLGAMGSAAAWHLARRGASVVGLDQYAPGHDRGSSHGHTRIIRSVYFEGALYNDLVRAAYAAWSAIEEESGETFFHRCGGIDMSLRTDGVFEQALAAASASGYAYEVLEGHAIESRFPGFDFEGKARGVFAPDSGFLDSDDASNWMRSDAGRHGAVLKGGIEVFGWRRTQHGFAVETSDGDIEARKLILAAGAWTGHLLPELAAVQIPERQVLGWYPAPGADHAALPIFHIESMQGERYYGFPPHKGLGLKIGLYHHRNERGIDQIAARGIDDEDHRVLTAGLDLGLPGVDRTPQLLAECRFTMAPENRFIIGCWPDDPDVTVLAPCSGHGYKFAPVIGEIGACLALESETPVDIDAFSVSRVL